jgi:hypothetical protein
MKWKWRTAPDIKSDKVLRLEKEGKIYLLLEAIESERAGENGKSKDGSITVRRV